MRRITPALFPLLFCYYISLSQRTATYNVVFTNFWNATNHSENGIVFPSSDNPHWSNIVGVNHNGSVIFFNEGSTATTGVENIAEIGNEDVFKNTEVQSAIDANNAEQFFELGDLNLNSENTASLDGLQINENYPVITLLTMIAPSPDWFAGVPNLNLRDGGGWKNNVVVDLYPYDAGTENGTTYSLSNPASNPIGTIQSIQGVGPFNSTKVATLTFTLQTVLNINGKDLKNLKIFPNPVQNKITISNPQNLEIKAIEIYNAIGETSRVFNPNKNLDNFQFDVSDLNSGIYFFRLTVEDNLSVSKKIIID